MRRGLGVSRGSVQSFDHLVGSEPRGMEKAACHMDLEDAVQLI